MHMKPALITWAKIIFEASSNRMRYNIVSRNIIFSETTTFTHNGKYAYEE